MHLLGQLLLSGALVLAVLAGVSAVAGVRTGDERLRLLSKRCVYATWAAIFAAAMILWHFILSHDFSNQYVARYSDTKMPWYYLVSSFWGGQKGSMLFWTFQLANFCALAVYFNRDRNREVMPYAIASMMAIFVFFDVVLLFATNPFEQFLVLGALPEGDGLNPLLQNPTMTFHPPTMLSAYAIWAIPFSFAVGALIAGKLDDVWIRSVRRWAVFGWFLLSMGNLFGAFWAYEELGWGGYWAWDPVENASFMPWMTATAYLHSVMIQERRGLMKVWNIVLVMVTFILTIFGTFITRTGLIESVHSFASGGSLKTFFLVFMAILISGCIGLVVWRLRALRSEGAIDSWFSREASFVANNVLFLTGMLVVFWGTMFPKINETITGREMSIGPPWFNEFMAPIGIAILALSGIGPLIPWRRGTLANFRRNFVLPIVWAFALTALAVLAFEPTGWFSLSDVSVSLSPFAVSDGAIALVALYFCGFTFSAVLSEFWRAARVRMRMNGEGPFAALVNIMGRGRRRYGGYVVHLGIVLLFLGFAGSAFQQERDVRMAVGDTATITDYTIRFDKLEEVDGPEKVAVYAHIDVTRKGRHVGVLTPGRFLFKNNEKTNTTEVDNRGNLYEDFYLALVNIGASGKEISLKVVVNPLVPWMYAGALLILLGAVLAMLPAGVLLVSARRRPAARRAAAAGATAVLLVAIAGVMFQAKPARAEVSVSDAASPQALDLFSKIRCDCGGCGDVPIGMCQPTCGAGVQMRSEVLAKLASGWTPGQILEEVLATRGETALAYPVAAGINFLHWLVPALVAVFGLALGAVVVRRLSDDTDTMSATATVVDDADLDAYEDRVSSELDRLR